MMEKMSTRDHQQRGPLWRLALGDSRGVAVPGRAWTQAVLRNVLLTLCAAQVLVVSGESATLDSSPVTEPPRPSVSDSVLSALRADATTDVPAVAPATSQGRASTNAASVLSVRNMDSLDDKQKLAVGDRVIFRVIEDQEDPKALTITDAGELDIPELGLVTAVGKTCKELAFEVKAKLLQTTYYHATVIIGVDLLNRTTSGRKVYVVGQVRNTGPQDVPAGETLTVSRVIMKAGGFTDFADKKRVRLVRGGSKGKPSQTSIVNIIDILERGTTEKDLAVEPEDLIYVPARAVNFF